MALQNEEKAFKQFFSDLFIEHHVPEKLNATALSKRVIAKSTPLTDEERASRYFFHANKNMFVGYEPPTETSSEILNKYTTTESFANHLKHRREGMQAAMEYTDIDPLLLDGIKDDLKYAHSSMSFFQSTVALLGLNDNARLIRGSRIINGEPHERGIVLFRFNGADYVFDPLAENMISNAKDYMEDFDEVFSDCRRNILEKKFSDEFCTKEGNVLTVKDVDDEDIKKRKVMIMPNSCFLLQTFRRKHNVKKAILYEDLYMAQE